MIAFLLLSFSYSAVCGFLKVTCPSYINVTYRSNTTLSCSANVKLVDITIDKCFNSVCSRIIDTSHNIKGTKGQIKFDHENKTVSLLIPEATPSDEGTYEWFLNSESSGYSNERTTLKVQAPYSPPQVSMSQQGAAKNLTCQTSRGYPLGQIYWFNSDRNLTQYAVSRYSQSSEGLYDIISVLLLNGTSNFSEYKCTVWNERSRISISEVVETASWTQSPFIHTTGAAGHKRGNTGVIALILILGVTVCGFFITYTIKKKMPGFLMPTVNANKCFRNWKRSLRRQSEAENMLQRDSLGNAYA
ncbi:ICOS ligand [Latimeria chalumnae]|uniref:ICOS ligand n=1 Tax=Latimeria chalumnae TaxID=7897 RepID=UPI0003C13CAF|nr:PREDICTED: ICOS ligand-like [Latimeria chalumnae]|eukprot:XP_005998594.1 PREDICTED: ICOS ligand-like [Latimeria chalumnae]